jgi:hypothetical protein
MSACCRTAEVVGLGKSGGTRDERLGDVGLVVLDEVHYLGDPWRGSVWEEAIINCPRHIQVRVGWGCPLLWLLWLLVVLSMWV